MVLLVPDTGIEEEEGVVLAEEDAARELEEAKKAELDVEEDAGAAVPDTEKVELDLEDAPFLEEEEEEEEEEEGEAPPPTAPPEAEKGEAPWYKKKSVYIPAAAVLTLIISLTIYFWTRPVPPAPPEPEVEAQVEEPAPPEEEKKEFLVPLEPFWIEQKDDHGNIRFLICRFTAVTHEEALSFELGQKTTTLRDAIFYYLKNKDLTYLSDKKNVEALKIDILSVMNQYLSAAQLETLLIEEYLVR